ncbi:MAG TPA: hypothetical protein VF239_12425 [Vicinamibacterales bacterium]
MRLALVTAWILAGAAVTGAAYWGLLNTPESTVLALASSALLVVVTLALLSVTINGAIALWINGASAAALTRSFRRIPAVVPALLVFALCWWIAQSLDSWVALHSGEINAWFIAAFGWNDMSWLFTAIRVFTIWLRWVIGGLLALSLMGAMAAIGWRGGIAPQWLRRSLRPRTLIAGTLWFVALIVLPWTYLVPWRPAWVPPTGAELAFIFSKLTVAAILMAAGVALMIHEVMRVPRPPIDPGEQRLAA